MTAKVREGSVYRRCARCGRILAAKGKPLAKRCPKCGGATTSKGAVTWSYRLDVTPDGAGKRKVRSKSGFATSDEAERALLDLRNSIAEDTYVERTVDTLGEYLTAWLDGIVHEVSASTWASYEGHVRNHIAPRIGHLKVQDVTRTAVRQMFADLRQSGRIRDQSGLSPKTVHNVFLTLHVALESAVRDRLLVRNPADDAHKIGKDDVDPESVHKSDVWWREPEMDAFLAHVAEDDYHAMWLTFLWTGARRGEVAAMRWRDLDLDAGTWRITRQWRKGRDGKPEVATLKAAKAGKPNRQRRTVALSPETVDALRHHRAAQNKLKLLLGADYEDHGLVFCLHNGAPMHPDGITQRWDRHVRDSGLRRIRLHDARHSHATWCLDNGMPLLQVSRRLGHASIQITADTYGHEDIESQASAFADARERSAQ